MLETFETLDRAAIGKRITEGRKHIKMRRETLAEKLDVSVQFIADVEYGKKGMSMKTFYSDMPGAGYYAKLSAGWKQIFLYRQRRIYPCVRGDCFSAQGL